MSRACGEGALRGRCEVLGAKCEVRGAKCEGLGVSAF